MRPEPHGHTLPARSAVIGSGPAQRTNAMCRGLYERWAIAVKRVSNQLED